MFIRKRALERIANEKVLFERRHGGDIGSVSSIPTSTGSGWRISASRPSTTSSTPSRGSRRPRLSARRRRARVHPRAPQPLVSLEHGRPLADFDILAFSIPFETDYLNVVDDPADGGDSARAAPNARDATIR